MTDDDMELILKQRDRQVMGLDDFTENDLQAILKAEPPQEAADFDHEVTQ